MIFPIGHDELRFNLRRPPVITFGLITTCFVVFLITTDSLIRDFGYTPNTGGLLESVTSQFIHVDFWHLFSNMLFLFMVGIPFEQRWSRPIFLLAFLLFGVVAALVHGLLDSEGYVPAVGASGAISGLIGAFLVCYPKSKILFAYFVWLLRFFAGTVGLPAFVVLPLFFVRELVSGLTTDDEIGYWAHAGGFAAGVVVALLFRVIRLEERVEDGFLGLFRGGVGFALPTRRSPTVEPPAIEPAEPVAEVSSAGKAAIEEIVPVAVTDERLEGITSDNRTVRLQAGGATVVSVAIIESIDPTELGELLPGVSPLDAPVISVALRTTDGESYLLFDREEPFSDVSSEERRAQFVVRAQLLAALFGIEPGVSRPRETDGSDARRFPTLEAFLDEIEQNDAD